MAKIAKMAKNTRKRRTHTKIRSTRRKRDKRSYTEHKKSCFDFFNYFVVCCIHTLYVSEDPVQWMPDYSYKEYAEELLETLRVKLRADTLSGDAYIYTVLGFGSMNKHKYKKATLYFNRALMLPYL